MSVFLHKHKNRSGFCSLSILLLCRVWRQCPCPLARSAVRTPDMVISEMPTSPVPHSGPSSCLGDLSLGHSYQILKWGWRGFLTKSRISPPNYTRVGPALYIRCTRFLFFEHAPEFSESHDLGCSPGCNTKRLCRGLNSCPGSELAPKASQPHGLNSPLVEWSVTRIFLNSSVFDLCFVSEVWRGVGQVCVWTWSQSMGNSGQCGNVELGPDQSPN